MAWTKEQQQAIDEEGKNIIVSAGAGSGKTAVLTERVIRKIKTGTHINELLILTFTNAAAAEMKFRIRKAIQENVGLEEELNLIDSAYITTFDSFSLSIVKKYHTKLNITNKIKITDEVIIDLAKNKILDQIMEENYLSPKQNFTKLIEDFCLKDDLELKKSILNIYKKIELRYDKEKYLETYINNYYQEKNLDKLTKQYLELIDTYRQRIATLQKELELYFDGDFIAKIEDSLKKMQQAKTYEEIKNNLEIKLPVAPRGSENQGKKIKSTISDLIKEIKKLCIYQSEEEMKTEIKSTKENVETIIKIISELDRRLTKKKQQEELYNFTDISRLAIKVVEENKEIRNELTNSFKEILVDEYQDTSDTQEKFISLIANNNVYMVGDIKQSIYRFRNANPYIFKNKYDAYKNSDQGIKIDLVKNFRSRKEVLENINLLFNQFMDDEIGGADYKSSHQMIFGNIDYLEKGSTPQNYNLELLTYENPEKQIQKEEQEAFIIGKDIIKKMQEKFLIFDKEEKKLRSVQYSDFVILLDKSKHFDLYKKIFEYLHIPLTILKDESLRKDQDVLAVKNLLKLLICIKEKKEDEEFKYSFTSVSRSFLYQTKDEEIYDDIMNNQYKESPLYKKCLSLIQEIDNVPASIFLNQVLESFQYEEKLITVGKVKSFRVRAEYFYNLCKNFEEKGNTIYDFVEYLENIFEKDYDLKFQIKESSSNSCKIMTIHKSKGLEYPICYFAGFSSRFNLSELKEKILYDNEYEIIIPSVKEYYKDTIAKTLLKEQTKKEEISEKIRLLYVALTRAREKIIIVAQEQEEQEEQLDMVPIIERKKYNSFLAILKSIYSSILPYQKQVEIQVTKEYLNLEKGMQKQKALTLDQDLLIVKELEISPKEVEEKSYSKNILHMISKEENDMMNFGTKIHEILEQIDFKDSSWKKEKISPQIKEKIEKFLNTKLIQENIEEKIYKEYEFTTKEDNENTHGIIDLLIEKKDKLIIIDYKLKNIEDENYDKQLNGYREVMKKKTNKKVECYLYSILEERFRKIEEI